jgi:predicted nucleic acid-binding protein
MTVKHFVDTNLLLYTVSERPGEQEKRRVAIKLVSRADWGSSAQVLQEFFFNATRLRGASPALTRETAIGMVTAFARYPIIPVDVALVQHALWLQHRYQTSYWDAAIIAAAIKLGADTLYSEDLSHGQSYETVTVLNPFL